MFWLIHKVLKTKGKDVQIPLAQQVKSFSDLCQKYRDIFLYVLNASWCSYNCFSPREAKKWNNLDVYSEEDKIFDALSAVDQAIRAQL